MSESKWQPVVLIMGEDKRLECECGALAIFVITEDEESEDGKRDFSYTGWCQSCFSKAQEEVEEPE